MKSKWELVAQIGYTFEFINKDDPMIKLVIVTTKGKNDAWNKLGKLFK